MSEKMFTIVVDTLGSDKGPEMVLTGASKALKECHNLKYCFTGDEAFISAKLKELDVDMSRVKIINAPDCITNYDHPVIALKQKTNSSLVKALEEVRDNDEVVGFLNAGSTGALLVGSMMYLHKTDLARPALAAILPAEKGGFVCVVDTGANIDCTSDMLVQFAHLGSELMHDMYKIENPRVGLLSNGAEESKGNALVKETHQLLKVDKDLNFVGNMEGSNSLSGECDVLVCDGFAGNQVLKVSEGIARRLITDIVKIGKKTGNKQYLELAGQLAAEYDFNSLGGALVLGVSKLVIKAHGACNENTIVNTTKMLLNLAENKTIFGVENKKD
ncbi:MAG: phosphate acyltransferase PlsX [Treponema sp.]|nr:phosphate acyltransferase PlsX [Treponema sp.]